MMSGGRFDINQPKIRPGTYINLDAEPKPITMTQDRGTVIFPALLNWGDSKKVIEILADSPDDSFEQVGYKVTSLKYPLPIRESLKKAKLIKLYNLNRGEKAVGVEGNLTVTAKYAGTRGNDITVVVVDNAVEGKDVLIYLDTRKILEFSKINKIEDLIKNDSWVLFSGTGDLENIAGLKLSGGTDSELNNDDILDFIEELEYQKFNAVAFPFDDISLKTIMKSMITNFREHVGKYVQAAVSNMDADYEGIISVANGVVLKSGEILTAEQCTYFVAAATASATNTQSNTQIQYTDAKDVYEKKNNFQSENLIKQGQLFFSKIDDNVVIEYDINSLTSYELNESKNKSYTKNKVIRVFDTFRYDCQRIFKPNKYDNDDTGWRLLEDDGKLLLKSYRDNGAITNVDFDNDFMVDKQRSSGDSVYIFVGLQPVDSAEKLYITIRTR